MTICKPLSPKATVQSLPFMCLLHLLTTRGFLFAAYQNAVREQKLATEISAAKRERDFYLSRVDKSRALMAMQERQQKVCLGSL